MVDVLGAALALLAAAGIAGQVICVRIGTEEGTATDALVVVLLTNIGVLVPLALVTGYPDFGLTRRSLLAFAAAGIVGTMLGRAFYYTAIKQIGASRAEPIKASVPLFAALVAVFVLGETLSPGGFAGILLIVAGVAVISWESTANPGPTAADAGPVALLFPLVAAFFFGVEPVFAKIGFGEGTPVLVGLAVKTLAATIAFVAYLRWREVLPTRKSLRTGNTRWYLAAGAANTMFLLAYYSALAIAPVVLVAPIMQLSPLLVVALSAVFLRRLERVTPRLVAASLIVVAGAIAVTLSS
mgnify:CR=1 FL=1